VAESLDRIYEPNQPLRMYIALMMLRAWNHGTEGYSSDVVLTVNKWIDGGMEGSIPYPDSPFFREWARKHGLCDVNGSVGFRFAVRMQ
jgi:hypothetical protein